MPIFGCIGYMWNTIGYNKKIQDSSHPCILITYTETNIQFQVYNLSNQQIVVTIDIRFDKNIFYKDIGVILIGPRLIDISTIRYATNLFENTISSTCILNTTSATCTSNATIEAIYTSNTSNTTELTYTSGAMHTTFTIITTTDIKTLSSPPLIYTSNYNSNVDNSILQP